MNLDRAIQSLISTTRHTDPASLTEALAHIAEALHNRTLHSPQYTLITRALVDKVAPRLSTLPPAVSDLPCTHLESILLKGNAAIAFAELTTALRTTSPSGADVVARALALFVDERLGAVERLRRVLSSGDVGDYVSNIVHLPSLLHNVLGSTDVNGASGRSIVEEDAYFGAVAEAIYRQTDTSDAVRDHALAELLRRLVAMKWANVLVSRWLRKGDARIIVATILRAPQTAIPDLMRALLDLKCEHPEDNEVIRRVTTSMVGKSPAACEACISRIPFERPLFPRQRSALKRVVKAVHVGGGVGALTRAVIFVAERWSAEEFSVQADMQLQRQVTRLLLYYLRCARDVQETKVMSGEESLMMILVQGVHHRLGDNDLRIRRHGMVVGEASSRHCDEKQLLKFDREGLAESRRNEARVMGDDQFEDGGDSDFSELAEKVNEESSDDEYGREGDRAVSLRRRGDKSRLDEEQDEVNGKVATEGDDISRSGAKERRVERMKDAKAEAFWSRESETQTRWGMEDDWSSLDSYESSSTDSEAGTTRNKWMEDYERIRRKIAAPMSVARLLGLLREVNTNDSGGLKVDVQTCLAGLRMVRKLAEEGFGKRGGALRECGGEVLVEISGMDVERYPDEYMGELWEARRDAMVKLVEMDVARCGTRLVEEVICGTGRDVGKRSEGIEMLSAGVRGAKTRAVEMAKKEMERRKEVEERKERGEKIGKVTRRARRGRREEVVLKGELREGWDDEGLGRVFYGLLWGLCEGGGADFLDVVGRDSQLWGQGLLCASGLAGAAGGTREGCEMRAEVVRVVVEKVIRECGDVSARRACALGLGAVVERMGDGEIAEVLSAGREIEVGGTVEGLREGVEWLKRAAEMDADVGVRRLAGRALGIVGRRVGESGGA